MQASVARLRKAIVVSIVLPAVLLTGGCERTAAMQTILDARAAYTRAAIDPLVSKAAPVELELAQRALGDVEHLRRRSAPDDEVTRLAYRVIWLARAAEEMAQLRVMAQWAGES
jgi:hypothetical protein